jgi:HEAT repeat protein
MFMRNILIAIGNSEASQYSDLIKILFENSDSTLIRSHAVWALGMVDPSKAKPYFQKAIHNESDENVEEEISFFLNRRLR